MFDYCYSSNNNVLHIQVYCHDDSQEYCEFAVHRIIIIVITRLRPDCHPWAACVCASLVPLFSLVGSPWAARPGSSCRVPHLGSPAWLIMQSTVPHIERCVFTYGGCNEGEGRERTWVRGRMVLVIW